MSNSIKYPIACEKNTHKLMNVSDVGHGKECNCYCFHCKEDLIAINKEGNKQRPHFRHDNTPCESDYELFLHWVTKEIFKDIRYITLPPINRSTLDYQYNFNELASIKTGIKSLYKKYNIPKNLRFPLSKNISIQNEVDINIDECSIEKTYNSTKGRVVIDIVIKSNEHELFIEPYYTNPIDEDKLEKLESIDISTISISLVKFGKSKGFYFKIADLKRFLITDVQEKSWKLINKAKLKSLEKKYLTKIEELIKSYIPEIEKYNEKSIKSTQLINELNELKIKYQPYFQEINNLNHQIYKLDDELKRINNDFNKYKDKPWLL